MSQFITELDCHLKECIGDCVWVLNKSLVYYSSYLKQRKSSKPQIVVPEGFETDLASVPRVPIIFSLWGAKAHREAVIHDYLYRIDANPDVKRAVADRVFLEAMGVRQKPKRVKYPMYLGVRIGGWATWHKRLVADEF